MDHRTFSRKQIALLLIFMIAASACGVLGPALRGSIYPSNTPAAEIKLTDQNGQPFQLSSLRGKITLVFFGFSYCMTECPATMAIIKKALQTAGVTTRDVAVLMVSTEPGEDTPESMKEFLGKFDSSYLGLLGTPAELEKSWRDYGVVVEDGGETHSSLTYVVDKKGNLHETISPDTAPEDIAADLKALLAED